MSTEFLSTLWSQYHWGLSLIALIAIFAGSALVNRLLGLVPAIAAAQKLNNDTFRAKMEKPNYAANQRWNRKWSALFLLVIFGGILPFCLTVEAQPWWRYPRDIFIILMVYDFVYYLTHRFTFHDSGFFGGPLKWMHAVHHRQHNPCRWDSSYIHPLEVAIGLGLYVVTIFVLSRFMGNFHLATVVMTWLAFTEINLHNHDLWTAKHFPFKYMNYASEMHHHHHAKFTGGNYATITLLYDWMFGTLDHGDGWGKNRVKAKA